MTVTSGLLSYLPASQADVHVLDAEAEVLAVAAGEDGEDDVLAGGDDDVDGSDGDDDGDVLADGEDDGDVLPDGEAEADGEADADEEAEGDAEGGRRGRGLTRLRGRRGRLWRSGTCRWRRQGRAERTWTRTGVR